MSVLDLDGAYRYCLRLARTHPENFFVGSLFLPRATLRELAAIYAYARIADDFADGDDPAEVKLDRLAAWERHLDDSLRGAAIHPVFIALGDTIRRRQLPVDRLRDLLEAFRYDAEFRPFATFDDLRGYCRNSANPVGRLVLSLFDVRDEERALLSDGICTALQLTNFWQDLGRDLENGRLYLPLEDLERFGVSRSEIAGRHSTTRLRDLVRFEVERTRAMFGDGLALAERVPSGLAREVRLFAAGGLAILSQLEHDGFVPIERRPTLRRRDKVRLLASGLVGA